MTNPRANQLIAALPELIGQTWLPDLEVVDMQLGDVLSRSGCAMSHVYFPTTGIVSLLCVLASGASTEIAVVGHEGLVGVSTFMGGRSTPSQAVVKRAGLGFRLRAAILKQAFDQGGALTNLLLRYTQALMTQIAQTAVCNRHHNLDQRLCRLLLFTLDRQQTQDLRMTHELIANMLGVRRESVSEAALALQKAGLIQYRRGHISVNDRPALETRTCECYAVVTNEYLRLLSGRTGAKTPP